jgi:hypothetical protein
MSILSILILAFSPFCAGAAVALQEEVVWRCTVRDHLGLQFGGLRIELLTNRNATSLHTL